LISHLERSSRSASNRGSCLSAIGRTGGGRPRKNDPLSSLSAFRFDACWTWALDSESCPAVGDGVARSRGDLLIAWKSGGGAGRAPLGIAVLPAFAIAGPFLNLVAGFPRQAQPLMKWALHRVTGRRDVQMMWVPRMVGHGDRFGIGQAGRRVGLEVVRRRRSRLPSADGYTGSLVDVRSRLWLVTV